MAETQATIVAVGLDEFLKAAKELGPSTNYQMRAAFRRVGDILLADAATWIYLGWVPPKYGGAKYRIRSAQGLQTRVQQQGVSVEQSRTTSTGQHGQFGAYQMRRLVVGAKVKEPEMLAEFNKAMDKVTEIFDK